MIFCASQSPNGVSLLNPDGSFVEGIGTGLQNVNAFVVQTDGLVVIAGTPGGGGNARYILRFFLNGEDFGQDTDLTYNGGASMFVDAGISDMELMPDGKILVGGNFSSIDGDTTRNHIVRLNANGGIDASLYAGAIIGGVLDMAVQPDGKIVAGGSFRLLGEDNNHNFARFNADGSFDLTFSLPLPDDQNPAQLVRSVDLQQTERFS